VEELIEKGLLKDFECNGPVRGWGMWGLPGLRDEDHLGDFPLSWKVTVEQYSIEELCYILEAKGEQFFDSFLIKLSGYVINTQIIQTIIRP
jgi:hypothetical protein